MKCLRSCHEGNENHHVELIYGLLDETHAMHDKVHVPYHTIPTDTLNCWLWFMVLILCHLRLAIGVFCERQHSMILGYVIYTLHDQYSKCVQESLNMYILSFGIDTLPVNVLLIVIVYRKKGGQYLVTIFGVLWVCPVINGPCPQMVPKCEILTLYEKQDSLRTKVHILLKHN
jgi:hypothetical protein